MVRTLYIKVKLNQKYIKWKMKDQERKLEQFRTSMSWDTRNSVIRENQNYQESRGAQ